MCGIVAMYSAREPIRSASSRCATRPTAARYTWLPRSRRCWRPACPRAGTAPPFSRPTTISAPPTTAPALDPILTILLCACCLHQRYGGVRAWGRGERDAARGDCGVDPGASAAAEQRVRELRPSGLPFAGRHAEAGGRSGVFSCRREAQVYEISSPMKSSSRPRYTVGRPQEVAAVPLRCTTTARGGPRMPRLQRKRP